MRRVSEPLDPRNAREKLREEFEQLRVEIGEMRGGKGRGDDPPPGGLRGRARAAVAVLALSAAVAAAAGNFALNGGRTPKDGTVSVPPSSAIPPASSGPEPGAITAARGSAETSSSLLSLIGPGLQHGILGSNVTPPSANPPAAGPAPLFVVGDPVSVLVHGPRGGDVTGGSPVSHSP